MSEIVTTPINDYLVIDPETLLIEVPDTEKIFGVYSDNNSIKKVFKCPKIVQNDVDLTACTIYVNYLSIEGALGQSRCKDIAVDGEYVTFSWVLGRNVYDSNEDGTVQFAVQAVNTSGDIVFTTRKATGIVYETVAGTPDILVEEYVETFNEIIAGLVSDEVTDQVATEVSKQISAADIPTQVSTEVKKQIAAAKFTDSSDGSGNITVGLTI